MQDQSHIVTWVPAEEDLDESGMKVMDMMGPKKKKNDERERERERETWFLLLGLESFITLAWQQAFLAEVELPQGIAGFHSAPGRTQERSSEESESDGHGSGKYAHTKQTPNADFLTPPSLHYYCQTDR